MKLWPKKDPSKKILIIDINSGSTGSSILEVDKKLPPKVISTSRHHIRLVENLSVESLEKALIQSLRLSLSKLDKTRVEKVMVAFSTPWITTRLRTYHYESEEFFSVNKKFITAILDQEEGKFYSELKEKYNEESEIFDSRITGMYVNGYATWFPIIKKAKSVELKLMMTAIRKSLITKIEEEVIAVFGVKHGLQLENFLFPYMKVFEHVHKESSSALLVNMTSEISDFLFVRNNEPTVSISLPFGPAYLIRSISEKMKISLELAESYLTLFAEGALDDTLNNKIGSALDKVDSEWQKFWKQESKEIDDQKKISHNLVIMCPSEYELIIENLLKKTFKSKKFFYFNKIFKLPKNLIQFKKNTNYDDRLGVLGAFIHLRS